MSLYEFLIALAERIQRGEISLQDAVRQLRPHLEADTLDAIDTVLTEGYFYKNARLRPPLDLETAILIAEMNYALAVEDASSYTADIAHTLAGLLTDIDCARQIDLFLAVIRIKTNGDSDPGGLAKVYANLGRAFQSIAEDDQAARSFCDAALIAHRHGLDAKCDEYARIYSGLSRKPFDPTSQLQPLEGDWLGAADASEALSLETEARSLVEKGQYLAAVRRWNRAVALDPINARYWEERAEALEKCGEAEEAAANRARAATLAAGDRQAGPRSEPLAQPESRGLFQPADRASAAMERSVRVFVSSTFLDMKDERDELARVIFPQLRKLCEQRGVTWSEIDLRWGITDEERAEGKVLPICLAEIERCRPFFIGLLGERYGWLPNDIAAELVEVEPWLREHRNRSVTELEIVHGVLKNPEMAGCAFLYLRDPGYLTRLPPDARPDDFITENRNARDRLDDLKRRVVERGLAVRQNYRDPKDLGLWVLRDLTEAINRRFPEAARPNWLDREAAGHEAFARARTHVYVHRSSDFEILDRHASRDRMPVVVVAAAGVGKSALLANWAHRFRHSHPDTLVVEHYIGASAYSANWRSLVRRLMGEFRRVLGVDVDVPEHGQAQALREAFWSALSMAAAQRHVVLVIDALNQLEDGDGARDLIWLPPALPQQVVLITSTLPGRSLDATRERGWAELPVNPLATDERDTVIREYLHPKRLAPSLLDRLSRAPQCANPLYLRALLEEMRLVGEHGRLSQQLDAHLTAETPEGLYGRILARWEHDYEAERPGLVRDSMSAFWAPRRGLSERELLDLLGRNGEPLPTAWWSPLHLAMEASLGYRSGLIGIGHDHLRKAVETRYLPTKVHRDAAHLRLAEYFRDQPLGPRKVEELPWQLARAEQWDALADALSDETFLGAAWDADPFDVKRFWSEIEAASNRRMIESYRTQPDDPVRDAAHTWRLSLLLAETGHGAEACKLLESLIPVLANTNNSYMLASAYASQAAIRLASGELDDAMGLLESAGPLWEELRNYSGLEGGYRMRASILKRRGRLQDAMALLEKHERLCTEHDIKRGLAAGYCDQAMILEAWGCRDEAMARLKESERINREIGDNVALQIVRGNQALILKNWGKLNEAFMVHEQEERVYRELGHKADLQRVWLNKAVILMTLGNRQEAMTLLRKQQRVCEEIHDKAGLSASHGNQGLILMDWGHLDEALLAFQRQEVLCKEMGDNGELQRSLGHQALIWSTRGRPAHAMGLLKQQEALCEALRDKAGLAVCYSNQARILGESEQYQHALTLHEKDGELSQELKDKAGLARSYANQGVVLKRLGRLEKAMEFAKKQEALSEELGDKDGLQRTYGNQALILKAWGRLDEAMALHEKEGRLCEELGDVEGLFTSFMNRAVLRAFASGDLQGARHWASRARRVAMDNRRDDLDARIQAFIVAELS